MHRWRHFLLRFTWMALWLVLLTAWAPTVTRLLVAADPVRAAMLAELCLTGTLPPADATGDAATDASSATAAASYHCWYCLTSALPVGGTVSHAGADFSAAADDLSPQHRARDAVRPSPRWISAPPRAPPALG